MDEIISPIYIQEYEIISFIGKGSFASVYLVQKDGKEYAMKQVVIQGDYNRPISGIEKYEKEVDVYHSLENCQECYFPKMYDNFIIEDFGYIILEYIDGINAQMIDTSMDDTTVLNILLQFLDAIDYLKECGYSHNDIADRNIIIKDNATIVIIDFSEVSTYNEYSNDIHNSLHIVRKIAYNKDIVDKCISCYRDNLKK